ncbi:uncharacterized protein KZ484_012368 [Pholidichthys leucotaenia]
MISENMLLGFILFVFLSENTVKCLLTPWLTNVYATTAPATTTATTVTKEALTALKLEATPDHPVAAGQTVSLQCKTQPMSATVSSKDLSWQRLLHNQTWKDEGTGDKLTLTQPEESGVYHCCANCRKIVSQNYTVIIIPVLATGGEKLGIAALVFSLLAMITCLVTVVWLLHQRPGATLTNSSNTAAKSCPEPAMASKGGFPQTDSDGDVYMNYTSTNQNYSDLDPTNMTGDNLYSTCLT